MSNITTQTQPQTFSLVPKTFDEAMKFADLISKSNFAPKDYKGKPDDILIAVQMGGEIGLSPMQALQSIAVINGRPTLWGDAAIAVCQNHPRYEYIKEKLQEDKNGNFKAICKVKRKYEEEYETSFSVEDAKRAGLWGRQGPWSNYPKRMLQMRARGFALRDKFSDSLKGIILREEAEDLPQVRQAENDNVNKDYESKTDQLLDSFEDIEEIKNDEEIEENKTENIQSDMVLNIIERLYTYGVTNQDIARFVEVEDINHIDDTHIPKLTEYGIQLKQEQES